MKLIPLTQGKFAQVDDEDFEELSKSKWQVHQPDKRYTSYANRKKKASNTTERMHRIIMGLTDPKILVDHINGNGLDNRKVNLRICTNRQNQANRKRTHGTSKYVGVYASGNGYVAKCNGENKKLYKWFKNEVQAALQYNEWAVSEHKEFATINSIHESDLPIYNEYIKAILPEYEKQCTGCKRILNKKEFNPIWKGKKYLQTKCRKCRAEIHQKRIQKKKEQC